MQFDEGLCEGQSEARTLIFAAQAAVDLTELRERLRDVFRCDAYSRVAHLENEPTLETAPNPERYLSASRDCAGTTKIVWEIVRGG